MRDFGAVLFGSAWGLGLIAGGVALAVGYGTHSLVAALAAAIVLALFLNATTRG